jgi:hypothetical protein
VTTAIQRFLPPFQSPLTVRQEASRGRPLRDVKKVSNTSSRRALVPIDTIGTTLKNASVCPLLEPIGEKGCLLTCYRIGTPSSLTKTRLFGTTIRLTRSLVTRGQTSWPSNFRKLVPCQFSRSDLESGSGLSSVSELWPDGHRSPPPRLRLRLSPRQRRDQAAPRCLIPHRLDSRNGFASWSR